MSKELRVFSGSAHATLGESIARHLGVPLGRAHLARFSDGEIWFQIQDNVRGADVFVIQPTSPPVNENLMELLVMLDAFKRASARRITAVLPYYGYSRQDRKVMGRVPITAKLVADLITAAGCHRVLAVDLHAGQIQGFFNMPVDHLFAAPPVIVDYLAKKDLRDPVLVSPDAGGVERARAIAKRLNAGLAIIDKRRDGPNVAVFMHLIGDVEGKDVVIIDDMIDTAGTIIQAVDALRREGARRILAAAVHGVLSGPAIKRINESVLEEVVITNSVPLTPDKQIAKIRVLSVAPLVAEAIRRIHDEESVSGLFV
jgi:ribose-phosphate pyrophosphokinase